MTHNVKSIRRRKNSKKIPQEFFLLFFLCLQAELLLASPVTECRAQNLHYSLASFVTIKTFSPRKSFRASRLDEGTGLA